MNTLMIDTSSNKKIRVGLRIDKKEHIIREKIGRQKAQIVLPLIDKLCKKKGLKITDIDGIEVNSSQGSFTGIRVGMSIANALSFVLKIPVLRSFDSPDISGSLRTMIGYSYHHLTTNDK